MIIKKRYIVSIIIVITTLICSVSAFAEMPDIAKLTNEELILLKTEIMNQMFERGLLKEYEIPTGRYTVGVDIPEGDYTISYIDDSTCLTVWGAAYQDYRTNGGLIFNIIIDQKNNILGKITLKEGNVIDFDCKLTFSRFVGLFFE